MQGFINYLVSEDVIISNQVKMKKYLFEKGIFRYQMIYNKLKESKRKLSDDHLHDFYRFDIRVRRLLFKYLTAYEIILRAKVLNNAQSGHSKIEKLNFGKLIDQYYGNDEELINVKIIRNFVMHHRMIQLMPIQRVLLGINIMLNKLDRKKFIIEMNETTNELLLIYRFYDDEGEVKYGMG